MSESKQKTIKIGYTPFREAGGNVYVLNMIDILSQFGDVAPLPKSRQIIMSAINFKLAKIDVAIINWEDSWIVHPTNKNLSIVGAFNFFMRALILKIIAKKIVFVRHNNYPHHTSNNFTSKVKKLIDIFEKLFDLVVIHSGAEIRGNRQYVPHPLYAKKNTDDLMWHFSLGDYFLSFGRILPYKNLDKLIKKFPPHKNLIIAGPCDDKKYLQYLKNLTVGKQVYIIPTYLSELEAGELVRGAKGIILVQDSEDMIVSGSYFYAITYGSPVIAIRNDFYTWVIKDKKAPGLFLFNDIDALCTSVDTIESTPKNAILQYAKSNYGNSIVHEAWGNILKCLEIFR